MNLNLLVGRSLLFRAQRRSRSSDRRKRSLAFVGSAATSCPDPNLARGLTRSVSAPHFYNSRGRVLVSERHRDIARRPNPVAPCTVSDGFGCYMQFSGRSYNLKEGRERTGHVAVRAPNEHTLQLGKLGVQFMHRDLAVPPSRGDDTLGQQGDPDARGHTAQNRFERTEFQRLCNEYSSLVQQVVQPHSI